MTYSIYIFQGCKGGRPNKIFKNFENYFFYYYSTKHIFTCLWSGRCTLGAKRRQWRSQGAITSHITSYNDIMVWWRHILMTFAKWCFQWCCYSQVIQLCIFDLFAAMKTNSKHICYPAKWLKLKRCHNFMDKNRGNNFKNQTQIDETFPSIFGTLHYKLAWTSLSICISWHKYDNKPSYGYYSHN